jgi:hypothetical protein
MAVIEKKIRLIGSLGKSEERALFDRGSTYSRIHPLLAKRLGVMESLPNPKRFGTAEKGRTVMAKERVSLDFRLNGYTFSDEFMVVSGLTERVIIGAKTLQAWRMKLDFENDEVIIDPRVTKLRLMSLT